MDKIVDFSKYCKSCDHSYEEETSDKCSECLENPVNEDSHKPINWESTKQ